MEHRTLRTWTRSTAGRAPRLNPKKASKRSDSAHDSCSSTERYLVRCNWKPTDAFNRMLPAVWFGETDNLLRFDQDLKTIIYYSLLQYSTQSLAGQNEGTARCFGLL